LQVHRSFLESFNDLVKKQRQAGKDLATLVNKMAANNKVQLSKCATLNSASRCHGWSICTSTWPLKTKQACTHQTLLRLAMSYMHPLGHARHILYRPT
jgi:hypothetical protein